MNDDTPTPRTAENVLADEGVFARFSGLRGLADCDAFWAEQPYGTRLYFTFSDGRRDYLHHGVLRAAISGLDRLANVERELAQAEAAIRECEMALRGCRQALDPTKECAICCGHGEPIYEDGMCVGEQCCGEPTDLNPQLDSAIAKLAAYRERKP